MGEVWLLLRPPLLTRAILSSAGSMSWRGMSDTQKIAVQDNLMPRIGLVKA
jgi:hypothetical protein